MRTSAKRTVRSLTLARSAKKTSAKDNMPDATTAAGIASLLEATFVNACMQLQTGYVDTLKLFIASAVSAYEQGFAVPALLLELGQIEVSTAGRSLMQEEVDLRTLWVGLVYLTAQQLFHPTQGGGDMGGTVPPDIRSKFNTFVYDVVNAKRGGWTFQTLKLEELMRSSGGEGGVEVSSMSAMERAILGQSMRVVFLTIQVIEETNVARGDSVPRPNIPGA